MIVATIRYHKIICVASRHKSKIMRMTERKKEKGPGGPAGEWRAVSPGTIIVS